MKKYALLLALVALAACSGDGDKKAGADAADAAPKKQDLSGVTPICPQVAILDAGQEISDYGGEKAAPAQTVAAARMNSVEGDCGYQDKGIDISFTLHMLARRGPRLGGDSVDFPYFVAVVDPSDNVLSRQVMTAHFGFSDQTAADDEDLHVFIPLAKGPAQLAGPDYRVLMGFIKRP